MTALVTILFALADRFCGGGLGWRASFPGRPIYYALVALPAALWFACQPFDFKPLALAGVVALVAWRSGSWRWFGASLAPENLAEAAMTWVRHLLILPAFWVLQPLINACFLAMLFAFVATGLGCMLRWASNRGVDINAYVELGRGAILGLMLVLPC